MNNGDILPGEGSSLKGIEQTAWHRGVEGTHTIQPGNADFNHNYILL